MRSPLLEDTLQLHLAALAQEGKSGKTEDGYRFVVTLYARWVREHLGQPATVAALTPEYVRKWDGWMAEQLNRSGNTRRHYQRLIKSHAAWLAGQHIVRGNPLAAVRLRKLTRKEPPVLDGAQVAALATACYATDQPLRNRALVLLMAETAVRVSGLCNLDMEDVQMVRGKVAEGEEAGRIRVRLKGGDEITVPFGRDTALAITQYLGLERRTPLDASALFLSRTGKRLQPKAVDSLMDKLADLAKVTAVNVTPHALRHYAATQWAMAGLNAFQIKALLGHKDVATSQMYVHLGMQRGASFYSIVDRLKLPASKPRSK